MFLDQKVHKLCTIKLTKILHRNTLFYREVGNGTSPSGSALGRQPLVPLVETVVFQPADGRCVHPRTGAVLSHAEVALRAVRATSFNLPASLWGKRRGKTKNSLEWREFFVFSTYFFPKKNFSILKLFSTLAFLVFGHPLLAQRG